MSDKADQTLATLFAALDSTQLAAPSLVEIWAWQTELQRTTSKPKYLTRLTTLSTGPLAARWSTTPITQLTNSDFTAWLDALQPITASERLTIKLQTTRTLRLWLTTQLLGGERIIASYALVRPVWTTDLASPGAGAALARVGGRKGHRDSMAWRFPDIGTSHLYITDRSVVTVPIDTAPRVTASVDRHAITGVHKKLRYQLIRQFRLVFTDGSTAAFITMGARTIPSLQSVLGSR